MILVCTHSNSAAGPFFYFTRNWKWCHLSRYFTSKMIFPFLQRKDIGLFYVENNIALFYSENYFVKPGAIHTVAISAPAAQLQLPGPAFLKIVFIFWIFCSWLWRFPGSCIIVYPDGRVRGPGCCAGLAEEGGAAGVLLQPLGPHRPSHRSEVLPHRGAGSHSQVTYHQCCCALPTYLSLFEFLRK